MSSKTWDFDTKGSSCRASSMAKALSLCKEPKTPFIKGDGSSDSSTGRADILLAVTNITMESGLMIKETELEYIPSTGASIMEHGEKGAVKGRVV
jgi:hypothetical protein